MLIDFWFIVLGIGNSEREDLARIHRAPSREEHVVAELSVHRVSRLATAQALPGEDLWNGLVAAAGSADVRSETKTERRRGTKARLLQGAAIAHRSIHVSHLAGQERVGSPQGASLFSQTAIRWLAVQATRPRRAHHRGTGKQALIWDYHWQQEEPRSWWIVG